MAAGLGYKNFVTGEVLTSGDVNGYLMQGVLVFASAAARNAAITSPQEGQFAYTKDTNGLWYYDGAAWVASGAAGDIEGVTAGVGISGGGTSGTVTITNSMATAITTAGDTIYGTGSGTFSRLGIGTANQVLTVNTGATAPQWTTISTGGLNLINTGGTSLSGASVTISSIPSTYTHLLIVIESAYASTANYPIDFRFNSDTSNNYTNKTVYGQTEVNGYAEYRQDSNNSTHMEIRSKTRSTSDSSKNMFASLVIYNYANTTPRMVIGDVISYGGDDLAISSHTIGNYKGASAISSISVSPQFGSGTTWSGGTIYVWGVK